MSMYDEIESETYDTAAGEYKVSLHVDYDAENPLTAYDHEGMEFAVFEDGRYQLLNTLSGAAGNAVQAWLDHGCDDEEIERRFSLWKRITGDKAHLLTEEVWGDRSTWYRVIVLTTPGEFVLFPAQVARATVRDFESYVTGDVVGYVTTAPNGDIVESVWGFYDQDEAMAQGRDAAEADAERRLKATHLVGAGFIGII